MRSVHVSGTPAVLKRTKVGLVGVTAPGFVGMHADPLLLQRSLGVQLHGLSMALFIERVRTIEQARVDCDVEAVLQLPIARAGMSTDELAMNSRYYLAMRDIISEENLDAIALQCWPELGSILGQWPYLALTRLTSEGVPTAMEGDVDGALTCVLAQQLGAGVGFITDWLEHDATTIHFWHGGVAPLPLCNANGTPGGPVLARHFNIAQPMVVDAELKVDMPVTVARLWRCDGDYRMTAFEGRTIAPRRRLTGNTALVEVDGFDVRNWFEEALHAGLPHHVAVFAGRHADGFRRLARVLKLSWFSPIAGADHEK
jgi:L-fucose isomerase-like protein